MWVWIRIQLFTPSNADPDPASQNKADPRSGSATLILTMSGHTLSEEMFCILVCHVAVLGILQATPGQPQRLLPVLHKAYFGEQNVLKFAASDFFSASKSSFQRVCFVTSWGSVPLTIGSASGSNSGSDPFLQ